MLYQEAFLQLWEQVKESVEEGSFAKLTMAKTIGKPNLKNIFLRPVYANDGFSVLLKYRFRERDVQDVEKAMTLDEAFPIIREGIKNPFMSIVLFTTEKDILFKVNKKGIASTTENMPTFKNIVQAESDSE